MRPPRVTPRQIEEQFDDNLEAIDILKKSGPIGQLASGLGKGVESKNVDDKTPVKVLSSDDEGDVIEVTDGPNKGTSGFVPKNSVN